MSATTPVHTGPFNVTVGRKILVGVSGLGLVGFLIGHLSGNLLLLRNDDGASFNAYAEFMAHAWFIWLAEIIIFGMLFLHIGMTLYAAKRNRDARGPAGYSKPIDSPVNPFSKYMVHTGGIFLVFLIIHLWSFFIRHKVYKWITGAPAQGLPDSLYHAAVEKFQDPLFTGFYVLAMLILSFHLTHGIWSAFQTLGLTINKKIERTFKRAAIVFSVVVCGGFAFIPLYLLLTK